VVGFGAGLLLPWFAASSAADPVIVRNGVNRARPRAARSRQRR